MAHTKWRGAFVHNYKNWTGKLKARCIKQMYLLAGVKIVMQLESKFIFRELVTKVTAGVSLLKSTFL